jgi:hypothetical protein
MVATGNSGRKQYTFQAQGSEVVMPRVDTETVCGHCTRQSTLIVMDLVYDTHEGAKIRTCAFCKFNWYFNGYQKSRIRFPLQIQKKALDKLTTKSWAPTTSAPVFTFTSIMEEQKSDIEPKKQELGDEEDIVTEDQEQDLTPARVYRDKLPHVQIGSRTTQPVHVCLADIMKEQASESQLVKQEKRKEIFSPEEITRDTPPHLETFSRTTQPVYVRLVDVLKDKWHIHESLKGEEVKPEMFDSIKVYIHQIFDSCLTFAKEMVEAAIANKMREAWKTLLEFLTTLKDIVLASPVKYAYLFYRFMKTDSFFERITVGGLIISDPLLTKIWNKVLMTVGQFGACTGTFSALAKDMPFPIIRTAYDKRLLKLDPETVNPFYTKCGSDDENEQDLDRGRCVVQCGKREQVRPQSFSSILGLLLGIPAKFMHHVKIMEILRSFNTLMQSYKNVHDLVMQLSNYLPDWIFKIFTITDPKKRFSYDSQHPGNPLYDMVQTYITMLTGENCGSSQVYEQFCTKWKDAEKYIMAEYTPNDQVSRTLKSYWSNANSIMRPSTKGEKPVPFVITLTGKPGHGKSSTWPVLLSGIMPGSIKEIRAKSYTRNSASDFFDGYVADKHPIFVYDDFGHMIDDTCAAEFMAIVSSCDYLPPFASISDPNIGLKGTSFAAPIVVVCTNFSDFSHCKQIADKTALMRRFGIVIHWDKKCETGEEQYSVYRTLVDGTRQPLTQIKAGRMTHEYTVRELQILLAREFRMHMQGQIHLTDTLTSFQISHIEGGKPAFQHEYNFMDLYNRVRTAPKELRHEYVLPEMTTTAAIEAGIGVFACVWATFAMGKLVDESTSRMTKLILATLGVIGFVGGVMIAMYEGSKQQEPSHLLDNFAKGESGETTTARASKPALAKLPKMTIVHAQTNQPEVNTLRTQPTRWTNDTNIMDKVLRNHVALVNSAGHWLNGLFLGGRMLLTLRHFVDECSRLGSDAELIVHTHRSTDQEAIKAKMGDLTCIILEDTDLAVIVMPKSCPPFTDITNYITRTPIVTETRGFVTRRTIGQAPVVFEITINKPTTYLYYQTEQGNYEKFHSNLQYELAHENGDCGNVLFANMGGSMSIVGFHNSGSTTRPTASFAIGITQVEVEKFIRAVAQVSWDAAIKRFDGDQHDIVEPQINYSGPNKVMYYGKSMKNICSAGKSTLIPSTIHDLVHRHTTKPALLRKKNGLDPMQMALQKYGLSNEHFDQDVTKLAVQSIAEEIHAHKRPDHLARVLTISECLNGIPGLVESVDLSTSSGYPFSLYNKLRGTKRHVVNGEPGSLTLSDIAQKHYDEWQRIMDLGDIPCDPFLATLKDERRKIEKVDAGKTRLFQAASLTSYLHNKSVFGAFGSFMKDVRGVTFSTLGMNRASREWHEMIMRFREVGENGIDGDQEEWDGRFKGALALELVEVFRKYLDVPENGDVHKKMYKLILQAVNPIIRVTWDFGEGIATHLLEVAGCMPSGWYLTFIMNSLMNAALMRICWILLVKAPYNDLYYFRRFVRDKFAGDDNFMTVADPFLADYNAVTIAAVLAKYGQKYTPSEKTGMLVPYRHLSECSFLKTKTGYMNYTYVPLFDMDANLDTINWIRQSYDDFAATEANCNDVLRNLYFYGIDTFNGYRQKILEIDPRMNLISYDGLDAAFRGLGTLPDPYGSFGTTKNRRDDPSFYWALQKTLAAAEQNRVLIGAEQVLKESGETNNMNSVVQQKETPASDSPAQTTQVSATLDEAKPQITAKAGVTLAEQQDVITRKAVDGDVQPTQRRYDMHLNEPSWGLKEMLFRNNLVTSFDWALTDAVGTYLAPITAGMTAVDVPFDLLQNDLVAAPFERFTYWRADKIIVRIQLTASRFHQGRLGVFFMPSMKKTADVIPVDFLPTRWTQMQHGFLDPANGTVLEMELPFRHYKGWLDLTIQDSLGQLYFPVLNQLQAATGASTTVQVKVFVSIPNSDFRVPRPGGTSFSSRMTMVRPESGFFANLAHGIGGELDNLVESILPHEITSAAAAICLDKPAVTEYPLPLTNKDQQYLSSSRAVENLERMALEPAAQYLTTDQFGDGIDELDMGFLLRKRNYLTTFNWKATDVVGTVLFETPTSPTHLLKRQTLASPTAAFTPTIMGYLANLFTYWRGSIVLTLQVVGTAFHEGRLDFCNHPGLLNAPADYKAAASQYINSQTIRNTNNTIEIRIPYLADTPWKRVWAGQTIEEGGPSAAGMRALDFILGCFSVRVAVQLKNPNNVANNVDVNVFIAAGEDFEFHTLSLTNSFMIPNVHIDLGKKKSVKKNETKKAIVKSQDEWIQVRPEAGSSADLNVNQKNDKSAIPLAFAPAYTQDVMYPHFGENYKSLREILKRYSVCALVDIGQSAATSPYSSYLIDPFKTTGNAFMFSIAIAYRLMRGPLNYKIEAHAWQRGATGLGADLKLIGYVTDVPVSNLQTFTFDDNVCSDTLNGFSVRRPPMVRFSTTQVAEFQVPHHGIYHSQMIQNDTIDQETTGTLNYYANAYVASQLQVMIVEPGAIAQRIGSMIPSIAFADETRFGVFLGFPDCSFPETAVYPNPPSNLLQAL